MIVDQSHIVGLSFFSVFLPFSTLLHDLILFQIKVSSDDCFKSFWWIANVFDHCILYIAVSNDVRIGFIFLFTLLCTLLVFKAWFVEVNLFTHDDGLNGK